ncbi:MAG: hypothetical protein OEM62_01010 [Acidobacteriota bacterium]|nr:hypothetical protein [Acidobacteriota bacterium]
MRNRGIDASPRADHSSTREISVKTLCGGQDDLTSALGRCVALAPRLEITTGERREVSPVKIV